jgi:hypothetical protein
MLLRAGKRSLQTNNFPSNDDSFDEQDLETPLQSYMGDAMGKRAQSMLLRAGKRGGGSQMLLRAGKRGGNMMLLRAGKRAGGTMYLRAGKRFDNDLCSHMDCSLFAPAKRAGNNMLLRAGKRGSGNMYLRAGKRSIGDTSQYSKKAGSMYLRAGKRASDADPFKRAGNSMLLRAGKRAGNSMLLRAGQRAAEDAMYLRTQLNQFSIPHEQK